MILKIKLLLGTIIYIIQRWNMRGGIDSLRAFILLARLVFHEKDELYDRWHALNLSFLKKMIVPDMISYVHNSERVVNYRIWTCWWQGEGNMPEIIRMCLNRLKKATDKEVVVITKNNYAQWIDIPDFLKKRIENKQIGVAHLSDYIRIALLCKYGGLWIDSTVFVIGNIPNEVFDNIFFTIRATSNTHKYIPMGKWNMQVLGSSVTNCKVFVYMKEYLEAYWKKFDRDIDYLFFDYGMQLQYETEEESRKLIDNVPLTNDCMHGLLPLMNQTYDGKKWHEMIQSTYLFKLTYKTTYVERCGEDKTFYYHLKELC